MAEDADRPERGFHQPDRGHHGGAGGRGLQPERHAGGGEQRHFGGGDAGHDGGGRQAGQDQQLPDGGQHRDGGEQLDYRQTAGQQLGEPDGDRHQRIRQQ